VVEHRDRLARFGVEHRQAVLAATGRRIIVVNPDEVKDDLVRDMTRGRGRRCVLAGMVAGLQNQLGRWLNRPGFDRDSLLGLGDQTGQVT